MTGCAEPVPPSLPSPPRELATEPRHARDASSRDLDAAPPLDPAHSGGTASSATTSPPRIIIIDPPGHAVLPNIRFPSLSVALGPNDLVVIDEVRTLLVDHPEILKVRVIGHADATETGGQALGAKRAEVVLRLLVQGGIDAARLEAASAGSSQPIESNDTLEGRAGNRRITFQIVERR